MTTSGDSTQSGSARSLLTIAHRAANDVETLRSALDTGVDFVEADVRFFRGVPEVRHSKTLGPHLLWEPGELMARRDAPVPTLDDVLAQLPGQRRRLMLDLKGLRPGLAPSVAASLREHAPEEPIAVSTPHWWMFRAFAEAPWIRMVPSAGSWPMVERLRELVRKGRDAWPNQRPFFACSVHRTLLTPEIVAELRRHVPHVITWPVDNQADLADARHLGVTGVTSKDLALLASLVANH